MKYSLEENENTRQKNRKRDFTPLPIWEFFFSISEQKCPIELMLIRNLNFPPPSNTFHDSNS